MSEARPTIREVAASAGVGISTVSKVLNHRTGSPEVIARVTAAADRLGYRPSRQAAGLRRGSTGVIGVLVPDLANPVYTPYLRGVESVARDRGRLIQVADGQGLPEASAAAIAQLATERVDGALLAGPMPEPLVDQLRAADIEVLPDPVLDRDHLRAWEAAEALATTALAARLVELGHRQIVWAVPEAPLQVLRAYRAPRLDAFAEVVGAVGGSIDVCGVAGAPSSRSEVPEVPEVLGHASAVVCASHAIAPIVLRWLHLLDRRVGRDVSVATYGDSPWTLAVSPALAVVRHDAHAEGVDAATALLDRLEGLPPRDRREPVASFVDRPSIALARPGPDLSS